MDQKFHVAVAKDLSKDLRQLFLCFLDVNAIDSTVKLSDIQKEFLKVVLLAVVNDPTSTFDRMEVLKCTALCQDPDLSGTVISRLLKVLMAAPLYGYAKMDPASFFQESVEWIQSCPASFGKEIQQLGEKVIEHYNEKIKKATASFGYDVDTISYQSGFCSCRYCEALLRFLRNAKLKEQIFRVSPKSVEHMKTALTQDAVIAPVIFVDHTKELNGSADLLKVEKKSALHAKAARAVLQQISSIEETLCVFTESQNQEPPSKRQKVSH